MKMCRRQANSGWQGSGLHGPLRKKRASRPDRSPEQSNQARHTILQHHAFGKTRSADACVVVPRIAWPAGQENQRLAACIDNTVSDVSRDVVHRTRRHDLAAGVAFFAHEQHCAGALHSGIELCAIANGMEMTMGHKVLISHPPWLQYRRAPKESARGAVGNGLPEADPVYLSPLIHAGSCRLIMIQTL